MCFSSTPVPPTAARIFVLSNSDSVVRYCSDRFPFVKHQYSWDTVGTPLGHGVCPTGTRCVPHWDTVFAPLGHGVCPTGTRWVSHWDTVCTPLGYGGCPTGVRCVSHWDTVRVPLGYGGCPAGVRWVSHRGPRSALEKVWSGQSDLRPNTGPHPPIRPHPITPRPRVLGEHDRGQRQRLPL